MWVSTRTARIGDVITCLMTVSRVLNLALITRRKISFSVKIPTGTSSSVIMIRPTSSATIVCMTSKIDAVTGALVRLVVRISLTLLESITYLLGGFVYWNEHGQANFPY